MSEEGSVYFGGNVEVSDPVVYQGFLFVCVEA